MATGQSNDGDVTAPVVVDLGKTRRSRIKALKRGRGRLMAEVADVVEDIRAEMGPEADGKQIIPIVLIYKQKPKRRKNRGLFGF